MMREVNLVIEVFTPFSMDTYLDLFQELGQIFHDNY